MSIQVKNRVTGELAELVEQQGFYFVEFARNGAKTRRTFKPAEWEVIEKPRPFRLAQLAGISYAADQELMFLLGSEKKRKKWHELQQNERVAWIEDGPNKPLIRRKLWEAIMAALSPLTREE